MKCSENLIFIVGVGRSGTSLVQSIVASHSLVSFPPEFNFIRRYLSTGILEKIYRTSGISGVKKKLAGDEYFSRLNIEVDALLVKAQSVSENCFSVALYGEILYSYAETLGKPYCGDKDPRSVEYLSLLHDLWPNAHVVHVIRDPRDVLTSKKKAEWSKKRHPLFHIFAGMVQFGMGQFWGKKLYRSNYYELVYEKLLDSPEIEIKKLCDGLGLKFEFDMLEFNKAAKRLVTATEMSWKKETLGPLIKDNMGKWKRSLNNIEIALIEKISKDIFSTGGYQKSKSHKKLTFVQMCFVEILSFLYLCLKPLYWSYRSVTNHLSIKRLNGSE